MLSRLGYPSMDAFQVIDDTAPSSRLSKGSVNDVNISLSMNLSFAAPNKRYKSYIGTGYHSAVVPPVILQKVCVHSNFLLPILLVSVNLFS